MRTFSAQLKDEEALGEMKAEITKVHRELQALKEKAEQEKATLQTEFDLFKADISRNKETLENEVTLLEKRRADALKPIDERMKQADLREVDIENREKALIVKELTVEEREHKAEQKIQYAEDLADSLNEKHLDIDSMLLDAKMKQKLADDRQKELLQNIQAFNLSKDAQNADMSARERRIEEDKHFLDVKERNIRERELALEDEKELIKSQRMTLQATLQEIKKHGIS